MNWKVLKTEEDYNTASLRLIELFHSTPNTPEGDELELLLVLVKDYDDKHYELPELDALEVIKYKMQERGMKAKDLEPIIGSKGQIQKYRSSKLLLESGLFSPFLINSTSDFMSLNKNHNTQEKIKGIYFRPLDGDLFKDKIKITEYKITQ